MLIKIKLCYNVHDEFFHKHIKKRRAIMIYGVALLAGCMFVGSFVGNLLGLLTGLNSDIGGVGFAMILLLLVTNSPKINKLLPEKYTTFLLQLPCQHLRMLSAL